MIKKNPQALQDAQTLARVRGALEGYKVAGAESVSVAHVLDLLNPRGLWSHDPEYRKAAEVRPQPDADPMTGCLPVVPKTA